MSNQRSENSTKPVELSDCDSESNFSTTTTTMTPKTPPRMAVPLFKARNQELLMAPKMKISRNRRRLMWIEDPSTEIGGGNEFILDMYRRWSDGTPRDNTGRLVYPRRARIRRDLFNARNLNTSSQLPTSDNSPSKNGTTATTTSPATPRMPVPFARVMSEELLRAPQVNASRSRRRVILIETPSSNDRSGSSRRNNRRLINPTRVRRNLFDAKNINQRPPTPTTDNDSDEN
ncbi:hypothetical protein DERP_011025 [Dermatophagoides pteronyssinus]|uniref:Uncharacterized protein n=1 Tax=Dermatophagoides pteronyssinus TaxID=6956 RepID=A0ABQ8JUZ6_DERPT|nr:hypothetical protein DERP_011025 [Dermatophagoides pteronyssinus]